MLTVECNFTIKDLINAAPCWCENTTAGWAFRSDHQEKLHPYIQHLNDNSSPKQHVVQMTLFVAVKKSPTNQLSAHVQHIRVQLARPSQWLYNQNWALVYFPNTFGIFQETGTDNISALCWCRHHIMTGVRRINRPTVWDNMTKCFYSLVEQQHICVKTPIKYTLFLCLYSLLVCLFVQLGMWCHKFFILSWSTSRLGLISQCVCIQARTWLQKNENEDSLMTISILPNWNSAPCC